MGKVIAITGAGDGLGRALARRCARDGDRVILLGRTLAKVEAVAAELGEGHLALHCDVTDPASVATAFETIAAHHPRIDVLINNAGIFEPFTLADADPAAVKRHVDTNLSGPVHCAHAALPLLRGGGHIINVTSDSAPMKMAMMWMYAGTKTALEYISEIWQRELEPEGIRVTVARCGHMRDETKTSWGWSRETARAFIAENAKIGISVRDRGVSHYDSVSEAFRAIIDSPADLHFEMISLRPRSRMEA